MAKFLEDAEGNKSSKRLFAAILIPVALVMAVASWCVALYHPLGDANFILKVIALIMGIGGGLDGLGVFDSVFKKKSPKS